MKRIVVLFAIVVLAACGGSGGTTSNPQTVATKFVDAAVNGRYSAEYDLLAPEMQSRITRDAFISCIAGKATPSSSVAPTIKVAEDNKVKYQRTDGGTVDAHAVTLAISIGATKENLTVWVVDGRVADLGANAKSGDGTGCVTKL